MKRQATSKKAPLFGGWEIGRTYHSAYWNQRCTVEALHGDGRTSWSVTVRWADGSTTTHRTARSRGDRQV